MSNSTVQTIQHGLVAEGFGEPSESRVTVICRDAKQAAWAERWFSRYPMSLTVVEGVPTDEKLASNSDVLLVDAGVKLNSGAWLLESFIEELPADCIRIVALCVTARELDRVRLFPSIDIISKPIDWQLAALRIAYYAQSAAMKRRIQTLDSLLIKANESLLEKQKEFARQASRESVTGLPNRKRFNQLVSRGLPAAAHDASALAVIVIGFARFKLVAEAMGQTGVNRVLAEIADRLRVCLTSSLGDAIDGSGARTASAAYLDSNRFGIMLTWSGRVDVLRRVVAIISDDLIKPFGSDEHVAYLSACLGVAIYPDDADGPDTILQRADNAMVEARNRGGGTVYCSEMADIVATHKLKVEQRLHQALDAGSLHLVYQPIRSLAAEDEWASAEVLLRWDESESLSVSTGQFISIAEESELILGIGIYVLDRACQQLKVWREQNLPLRRLCINVAKSQLLQDDFAEQVSATLGRHGLQADDIELELSERGVLSRDSSVLHQIQDLSDMGIRLSIDDFGTGESSISYLKDLPIDVLKIDKSYIAGIPSEEKNTAMTSAMVTLGQHLGLHVIAEGVETEAQYAMLKDIGCDACQGYLLAKPLRADALCEYLGEAEPK